MLLKAYGSLLRQAKTMVEDYEHLASDADFKIDPARRRRIAKMREAIRKIEELKCGTASPPQASQIADHAQPEPPRDDAGFAKGTEFQKFTPRIPGRNPGASPRRAASLTVSEALATG